MRTLVQKSFAVVAFLFFSLAYAGAPLWQFTPDPYYPPTQSVTPINTITIQYTITNQSSKSHTLQMTPIAGVTQVTSGGSCPLLFTLGANQSCILTLSVKGSTLSGNIIGGPVVCQKGNTLQCYQPSSANSLNITLKPISRYLITPSATANGSISPNTPTTVVAGSSLTFTAQPDTGYQVDQWLMDGTVAQKGGSTFTLSNITKNHLVEVSFTRQGTLFVGMADGSIHFSTNNGLTWTTPQVPWAQNAAVNSLFATQTTLYAASADGKVYYTTDNGSIWSAITPPVLGGVNSVFVTNSGRIYAGSPNGTVYYTDDKTTWLPIATQLSSAINSLFITPDTTIYTGNADGNVYYLRSNESTWNQVVGPFNHPFTSIQNVFVVNNTLYVNIRSVSSNSTLPPGTVDFEYVYSTDSITANPVWNLLSQITYTLFVNSDASTLYAGTQNGHVFSLTTGDDLGFIANSPITSIFFIG